MKKKVKKKVEKDIIDDDFYLNIERNPKDGLHTIVCHIVEDGKKRTVRSRPASQMFIFGDLMLVCKGMLNKKTLPDVLNHLHFK